MRQENIPFAGQFLLKLFLGPGIFPSLSILPMGPETTDWVR